MKKNKKGKKKIIADSFQGPLGGSADDLAICPLLHFVLLIIAVFVAKTPTTMLGGF